MMLIGHSIAQSVHLMQRSSSSRNMPRNRSDGSFFCSGYWIVTFFVTRCRPVTESPSKMSRSVILSSHFLSIRRPSCGRGRRGGQAVPAGKALAQPREQEEDDEEPAEDPGEDDHAGRPPGPEQERERHDDDVDERHRDEPLPSEPHQLVETVPRERRAEPDVDE